MELYILRHGIAEELSESGADNDRRLTEEGVEKTKAAGKALCKLGTRFDLILASPFARAWKTAELIADALDCRKSLHQCLALSSGKGSPAILSELKKVNSPSVLLVGHEPELSGLISTLLAGSPGLAITMKKGGLCKLSCISAEPGGARLEWLLTAKHLCRMT
jgi:phosphohistidine phosphatase